MPEGSVPLRTASALVRDELLLDGNSRQNLALMDPIVFTGAVTGARNRASARGLGACAQHCAGLRLPGVLRPPSADVTTPERAVHAKLRRCQLSRLPEERDVALVSQR